MGTPGRTKITFAVLLAFACAACTTSGSGQGAGVPASRTPSTSRASTHQKSATPPPHATSSSAQSPTAPIGGPVPANFVPLSATYASADEGWVLGTAPCSQRPCTSIVRTRDGGRSWQGIPAPRAGTGSPHSAQPGAVTVLRFADANDGWAGVADLYSTHDGGATWTRESIGGPVNQIETGGGYVFVTSDRCFTPVREGCATHSRLYASPIGNDDWQPVTGSLATGGSEGALVVDGADWYLPTADGIYHGQGRTVLGTLPRACPNSYGSYGSPQIAVADPQHLDAVCVSGGAAGSAQYRLYGSTDGGHSWRPAGKPFLAPSALEAVADNTRGVLLLAESSGGSELQRTTTDGGSFDYVHLHTATGGIPWTDAGFTTPDQAFAVLGGSAMYLSHDAGRTFGQVRF